MKSIAFLFCRWFAVTTLPILFSGCVAVQTGRPLSPAGPLGDGPMIVRKVMPDTPAESFIHVGDRIVALGSIPIRSIDDYFKVLSQQKPATATIEREGSGSVAVPISRLIEQNSFRPFASPLADGETVLISQPNVDGQPQLAGLFFAGPMSGSVMVTLWDRALNILEVRITLSAFESCSDCTLKNVALMDWDAKSWIQPAPPRDVAWAIYPPLNQPASQTNVPPPIPIGIHAVSSTSGNINAYNYGSYIYGTYTGQTVTSVVPQYDYTLTNVALMHNLAATIQADNIRQQNNLRQEFFSKRIGNLRFGPLNRGEKLLGHLFFAAPKHLAGPYVVFIDGGENRVAAVRFNP